MVKIATHDAKFHTDDVFAVATLFLVLGKENCEVLRTRDENIISSCDYVVDVGGLYDESKNRFDHHQIEGAGTRENGIPYASFGLVWKKFDTTLTKSEAVAKEVERVLVTPIDAIDNGVDISKPVFKDVFQYDINSLVNLHRSTWKESQDWDNRFLECVDWAMFVLSRVIKITQDAEEAVQTIKKAYVETSDKRIIVLDEQYDFGREIVTSILSKFDEPVYAVLYRSDAKNWQVVCMRKPDSFESKRPLPPDWRGKRDGELAGSTGISDAVFCHRSGFMCIVGSKIGAIKLAEKALNT